MSAAGTFVIRQVCGYGEGRITWVRDDKSGSRVNRAQILEATDKSLKRLQTDHVDLMQARCTAAAELETFLTPRVSSLRQ